MKQLATALLVLCVSAMAEDPPIAIQNARIVTVSGPVIARGTVVIRKGLIEAVGENVQIPADAVVIAGEGLTVYPGLIDALTNVGIPSLGPPAPVVANGGRGGIAPITAAPTAAPVPRAMGPEDRPRTTSWALASDELLNNDRRMEIVRGAGVTTTATFPTRGIFGGQGALVNLVSGEKAGAMVLVSPIGQYAAMNLGTPGPGGANSNTVQLIEGGECTDDSRNAAAGEFPSAGRFAQSAGDASPNTVCGPHCTSGRQSAQTLLSGR